jgi:hypothetical protein
MGLVRIISATFFSICHTYTYTHISIHPYEYTYAHSTPMSTFERLCRFDLEIYGQSIAVDGDVIYH